MAIYNLATICQPQYVQSAAPTALVFAPPASGVVVPANVKYQINTATLANKTDQALSFQLWRVPSGLLLNDERIIVPKIVIPPANENYPYFSVTALWGIILNAGDALWAQAQTVDSLIIQMDGGVLS